MSFGVAKNGEAIQQAAIRRMVTTGIEFHRLLPELVPLYEEREAATFSHYNFNEWQALHYSEKAMAVAHYRLSRLVGIHEEEARQKALDRLNRRR